MAASLSTRLTRVVITVAVVATTATTSVVGTPGAARADTAQSGCTGMDPFTPALAAQLAATWPAQRFSASIYDERTGCQFDLRPDLRLTTASVLKVEVMAGILLRAQSQGRPLSAQERSLILPMITESHDAPTTALWQSLGGAAGMTALDSVFGMTDTTQVGPEWGVTVTSARDQVHLLRQVLLGDFGTLGPSYRADAFGYMTSVIPSQRWGITAGVPAGWTVANKNGFATSVCCAWRINSTGVVYDPTGGAYAVAILSDGWPDEPSGIAAVETISRAVAAQLGTRERIGPSAAVAGGGNQFVFWRGSNGDLSEAFWTGSAWVGPFDIGGGPLGSEPSAGVDGKGNTYAFWKGTDGNLWEDYWIGGLTRWSGAFTPVAGQLASLPSVAVAGNGNQFVFWKGTNGDLWEAIWTGSAWAGPYDEGMGQLGSGPSAGVDAQGRTYVFWRGTDGGLWEGFWNGSRWIGPYNVPMGQLGSVPTVAVAGNADQFVFWQGTNGELWEGFWTGSMWAGPYDEGMGQLGSEPSAGVDGSGSTHVFWRGTDGNLWQGFWSGSRWIGPNTVGVGQVG